MLWNVQRMEVSKQIFLCKLMQIFGILKKTKNIKKERKKMLKNNNTKPSTGYDRVEFYIDFVQVLLSAFMLGYLIGKKKKEKDA